VASSLILSGVIVAHKKIKALQVHGVVSVAIALEGEIHTRPRQLRQTEIDELSMMFFVPRPLTEIMFEGLPPPRK